MLLELVVVVVHVEEEVVLQIVVVVEEKEVLEVGTVYICVIGTGSNLICSPPSPRLVE